MDDIKAKLRDDTRHVLWSQDRVRLYAAEYIERLEACVRALDDAMWYATAEEIAAVLDVDRGRVWGNLVAARHRVNLPEIPDSSPSCQAALDNSNDNGTERKEKANGN